MEARVSQMILSGPIVVFSKTWCGYCSRAKSLLQQECQGKKVVIFELDIMPDGDSIQDALKKLTKQSTVPNVFIAGKHVGGCDAVTALHAQKKLAPLIAAAS